MYYIAFKNGASTYVLTGASTYVLTGVLRSNDEINLPAWLSVPPYGEFLPPDPDLGDHDPIILLKFKYEMHHKLIAKIKITSVLQSIRSS